jgi:putative addiction module killer protein
MIQLLRYQREDGREPFTEWLNGLRDLKAQARIRMRLNHLALGNFGDCEPVGEGVLELRVHAGPGYSVYCARHGKAVVLLHGRRQIEPAAGYQAGEGMVVASGGLTVAKGIVGVLSGSLAILSEAAHSLIELVAMGPISRCGFPASRQTKSTITAAVRSRASPHWRKRRCCFRFRAW